MLVAELAYLNGAAEDALYRRTEELEQYFKSQQAAPVLLAGPDTGRLAGGIISGAITGTLAVLLFRMSIKDPSTLVKVLAGLGGLWMTFETMGQVARPFVGKATT